MMPPGGVVLNPPFLFKEGTFNTRLLKDHIFLCVCVCVLVESNAQGYVLESPLVCLLKLVCNLTLSWRDEKLFCKGFHPFSC